MIGPHAAVVGAAVEEAGGAGIGVAGEQPAQPMGAHQLLAIDAEDAVAAAIDPCRPQPAAVGKALHLAPEARHRMRRRDRSVVGTQDINRDHLAHYWAFASFSSLSTSPRISP